MPPKNMARITKPKAPKRTSVPALSKAIAASKTMAAPTPAAETAESSVENAPIYFWKPHQQNGFLGQWYESQWTHEGSTYATAEMWMMVQKARLFGDEEIAKSMLETTDPKTHKALGRKVRDFEDRVWNGNKYRIVSEGTYLKFTAPENAATLRRMLLETGERELVEASPLDRVWGVGFGEKNAGRNRHRWGQNLLGKALMDVRARLREEEGKE